MFAKLKKKIENEGGNVPTTSDATGKSTGLRDSLTNLSRAGSIQHLGVSPPGSVAGDSVSMQDESVSRDEIVCLLQKKSEQCKKLEGNISDLAALVKDKSKTVEKLETALRQQEEYTDRILLEQKQEFDKERKELTECHQHDKLQLERLLNTDEALKACQTELRTKTVQCQSAEVQVEKLTDEVQSLKLKRDSLESDILKLREENRERADLVISLSKDRATFEKRLDEMNKEIKEKQMQISQLQAQLSNLDKEYKSFVSDSDLRRNQVMKQLQEKDDHIDTLQERVRTLEQRISDFSLSGDDQLNALQVERDLMEQKLTEAKLQVADVKSTLCDKISILENQVSQLSVKAVEDSEKLAASHKSNDQMRESFHKQVEDLRGRLEETEKRSFESLELAALKETNYRKQIEELQQELSKQKLQAIENDTLLKARIASLDMQIKDLETSRNMEKEEKEFKIILLEQQEVMFADKKMTLEGQVSDLEEAMKKLQGVILEKNNEVDSMKQQIQVSEVAGSDQNSTIRKLQEQISEIKLEFDNVKEARNHLEKRLQISEEEKGRLLASTADLQAEIETLKTMNSVSKMELERMICLKSETEVALKQKLESLEQMIKQDEISKTESGLHSERIDELSNTISSLQTQLSEKNRILKKQEQMLKDLRVTLQRELKVQSLPNDESQDTANTNNSSIITATSSKPYTNSQLSPRPQESQLHQQQKQYLHEQNYKQFILTCSSAASTTAAVLSVQASQSNMVTLTASSSSVPGSATDALTMRTNTVRRELDKDINFLYLKHVILKFMLSREAEAIQLIKAVSMLLNFTHQEQQLIKDTLEWKMSWFGHRPSVGEGQTAKVIPPAL